MIALPLSRVATSLRLPMLAAALTVHIATVTAAERGPVPRSEGAPRTETEARVIVKYKADASLMRALGAGTPQARPQHAQALSARLGLSLQDGQAIGSHAQVLTARGIDSSELARTLGAQRDVEYAVVDGRKRAYSVPNDPLYAGNQTATTPAAGQWYLRAPTSSTLVDATSIVSSIDARAAWQVTTGSQRVVVAVLDTGVVLDHPDLASKLLPGYDFVTDLDTAVDGDARDADASDPGDHGCSPGEASSWHGTQTAGLIGAATNNATGMAGAGRDVMLLPVRVLGQCGGYDSDILAAMLWSAGLADSPTTNPHPAKVINLSLGSTGACSASYADVVAQVRAAGVVVVAAAGNDGRAVGTPANCAGVIAVAGVRHSGTKVGYSDLGSQIAISAPAGNCVNTSGTCLYPILTTSNSGTTTPVKGSAGATYTTGGSDATLGTSFAAPLVAGTAALMFAANAALTPDQVSTNLKATARAFPSTGAATGVTACTAPAGTAQNSECYCTTSTCGAGLLDAGAAVAAVATVSASIAVASTSVTAGSTVALDGSGSRASAGASIGSYRWELTEGASLAQFTSAVNAATATLNANAAGNVTVSLTVVDTAGREATSTLSLSITGSSVATTPEAPATATDTTAASADSGGGGATGSGWLMGWLVALAWLWAVSRRRGGEGAAAADRPDGS